MDSDALLNTHNSNSPPLRSCLYGAFADCGHISPCACVCICVCMGMRERERERERESVCVASCSPVLHSVHCSPFTCIINASLTKRGVLRGKWPISPYCTLSQAHTTGGCSTQIRRIFVDFIPSNLKHAHTTRFEYRGTSHTTRYY